MSPPTELIIEIDQGSAAQVNQELAKGLLARVPEILIVVIRPGIEQVLCHPRPLRKPDGEIEPSRKCSGEPEKRAIRNG